MGEKRLFCLADASAPWLEECGAAGAVEKPPTEMNFKRSFFAQNGIQELGSCGWRRLRSVKPWWESLKLEEPQDGASGLNAFEYLANSLESPTDYGLSQDVVAHTPMGGRYRTVEAAAGRFLTFSTSARPRSQSKLYFKGMAVVPVPISSFGKGSKRKFVEKTPSAAAAAAVVTADTVSNRPKDHHPVPFGGLFFFLLLMVNVLTQSIFQGGSLGVTVAHVY